MSLSDDGTSPDAPAEREYSMSGRVEEALLLAQSRARAAEEALSQYDARVEETAFRALALLEESRFVLSLVGCRILPALCANAAKHLRIVRNYHCPSSLAPEHDSVCGFIICASAERESARRPTTWPRCS
jgi:hypothetical protein